MTDSPQDMMGGKTGGLTATIDAHYWCCSRDSWSLSIDAVEKADAGKYICQLNTARPISISGTLSVVGEIQSSCSLSRIGSVLYRIIFLSRSTFLPRLSDESRLPSGVINSKKCAKLLVIFLFFPNMF